MIKAIYKYTPTAYTCNIEQNFNSIEDVIRFKAKHNNVCIVSIADESGFYHLAQLYENGSIRIEPIFGFRSFGGQITLEADKNFKLHISKKFNEALEIVRAELLTPKLA